MYFDPKTLSGDFLVDLFPAFVDAELPQIGYTYLCICRWKMTLFLNSKPRHFLMTLFEVHFVSNVLCILFAYGVGRPDGKRRRGRLKRRRKDNIKMYFQRVGWGAWAGLIWLRIGTGGWRL